MTARTDKLRRAYDKLTPFERVELLLAAREAGDRWEIEALDDCCPTVGLLPSLARLLSLQHSACVLVIQLLAREVLLVAQLTAPDGEAAPPSSPDSALLSLLQVHLILWRAFVAWCRDLDHDPHQVLLMAPLGRDHTDPVRFLLDLLIERFAACSPDLLRDPDQERLLWRHLFRRSFCY